MLSVILTILKILGIVLLIMLGILLVVLLLLLFVPFRYKGHGTFAEDKGGEFSVTWLFRFFRFHLQYLNSFTAEAKVLWFTVWKTGSEEKETTGIASPAETGKPEAGTGSAADTGQIGNAASEPAGNTAGQTQIKNTASDSAVNTAEGSQIENAAAHGVSKEEGPVNGTAAEENAREGIGSGTGTAGQKTGEKKKKKTRTPAPKKEREPFSARFPAMLKRAGEKKNQAGEFIAFFEEDSTKRLIRLLKKRIWQILKEIWPRSLDGEIRYGAADPAGTGQFAAAAALLIPLYEDRLKIVPEFDREEIYADVSLGGRLHLAVPLWAAARIWFDRDFQKTLRRYKKWKKKQKG